MYWCCGYKQVAECFLYCLQDLSRDLRVEFNRLVIIDNRLSCDDDRLRTLHHKLMLVNCENYSNFNNLTELKIIGNNGQKWGWEYIGANPYIYPSR